MASNASQARAIIQKAKLAGSWKMDKLLSLLDELIRFEVAIERKKKITQKIFITCFVMGVILLTASGWFELWPMAAAGGGSIIIGISRVVLNRRFLKKDIDDDVRMFVRPLLETLKEDIKRGSEAVLNCELRPLCTHGYQKSSGKPYSKGAYPRCRDFLHERQFLSLKLRLYDNNRLSIKVKDTLIKTEKVKTNPRGKTKTKNLYRRKTSCRINLRLNENLFRYDGRRNGKGTFSASDKGTLLGSTLSMKERFLNEWHDHMLEPVKVINEIAALYARLRPARQ
jgi:hypothetical protein